MDPNENPLLPLYTYLFLPNLPGTPMRVSLILCLLLSACSKESGTTIRLITPNTFAYPKLNFKIVILSDAELQLACSGIPVLDDGTPTPKDARFEGCWNPSLRTIFIDKEYPEVLVHELCHVDDQPSEKCDTTHWDRLNDKLNEK